MRCVLPAPLAVPTQLQTVWDVLLVLAGVVIAPLAFGTGQGRLLLRHVV